MLIRVTVINFQRELLMTLNGNCSILSVLLFNVMQCNVIWIYQYSAISKSSVALTTLAGRLARLVVAQFTVYEVTELSTPEMNVNLQWTMVNVYQYLLNLVLFSRSYVIAFWYLLGEVKKSFNIFLWFGLNWRIAF